MAHIALVPASEPYSEPISAMLCRDDAFEEVVVPGGTTPGLDRVAGPQRPELAPATGSVLSRGCGMGLKSYCSCSSSHARKSERFESNTPRTANQSVCRKE